MLTYQLQKASRRRRGVSALLAALLIVSSLAAVPALLQSVERTRAVSGAGATSVTVGGITLRGTLGQPFVGGSASGNVTVRHGFWHGVQVSAVNRAIYLPLVLAE